MDESINLFEDISNSTWFSESIIVLFFNKKDLFEKKIGSTPITTFFKDYCGDPKSVSESINHIRKVFLNSSQHPEEIYTHVTTATDSKNIDVVFNAVKDTILKTNLKRGGFI
ncbi:hypothetical protein MHBO_001296 [Bonamia ostreae]|uniref:Uncharacterized protein n=1 Tax=Bonamia ostreae TaxID=126728 RepID=A0ABV2AII5_9EUKA